MTTRRMTRARLKIALDAMIYFDTVLEDEIVEHSSDEHIEDVERRREELEIAYFLIRQHWRSLAR